MQAINNINAVINNNALIGQSAMIAAVKVDNQYRLSSGCSLWYVYFPMAEQEFVSDNANSSDYAEQYSYACGYVD